MPTIRRLLSILLMFTASMAHSSCVILLHGLARTESSMSKMEERLKDSGYLVINEGYPSRDLPIEDLADIAIRPAIEKCEQSAEVNFITHSLGGILVRQYLAIHNVEKLNHVVMLGPPNQGSEVVDKLDAVPGFHFINGDAGLQLGTGTMSIPNQLGPVAYDVGIIAGNKSVNLILSTLIPGKDDGKVSVERTRLDGMNDHIELSTSHPFMMRNDEVIDQVIYYLVHGNFDREQGRTAQDKR